jgi:hypothetical protein
MGRKKSAKSGGAQASVLRRAERESAERDEGNDSGGDVEDREDGFMSFISKANAAHVSEDSVSDDDAAFDLAGGDDSDDESSESSSNEDNDEDGSASSGDEDDGSGNMVSVCMYRVSLFVFCWE